MWHVKYRTLLAWSLTWSGVLAAMYLASRYSYLLFHSLAEIFSIGVAFGIFSVMWNSRRFLNNNYLLFVGIGYFFLGLLDTAHLLSYEGMGVFVGFPADLSEQVWIGLRYIQGLTFMIAPIFLRRTLPVGGVFAGYAVVSLVLLTSVFYWWNFPPVSAEAGPPTSFQAASDLITAMTFIVSVGLLVWVRADFDVKVTDLLIGSLLIGLVSDAINDIPGNLFDSSHLVAHFLMIISFYLIYKAIVETGLMRPYNLLFRHLSRVQEALAHQARELARSNRELETQIAERKRIQERLLMQERLVTLGKLSASIAHEIRNPLAVIDSSIFYLKSARNATEAKIAEHYSRIRDAVRQSTNIIQSLQDLALMGEPVLKMSDLRQVIKESIIESDIPQGIKVVTSYPDTELNLNIDPAKVKKAVQAVVKNAIQSMESSGRLTIGVGVEGGQAQVSIADTGPGISPEVLSRIFEPLFSTRAVGIGLGLYIARMIIERHQGTIELRSQLGRGTTVTIRLPLA